MQIARVVARVVTRPIAKATGARLASFEQVTAKSSVKRITIRQLLDDCLH